MRRRERRHRKEAWRVDGSGDPHHWAVCCLMADGRHLSTVRAVDLHLLCAQGDHGSWGATLPHGAAERL